MMVHIVNVVSGDGKILVQREFDNSVDRTTYADILVDIMSVIEERKVKHVEKEIIKENPGLKYMLSSAREIEDKFVVTEMVVTR
ncbi:hypothetical protein AFV9_gp66 [Betalipothrixvirus uzonense]|uniref:Uncharacterized protein n=1 Tax=Betalipothrixvirus uzonense TaxID=512792 RepID=B2CRP3_9VIRU|nr:hypothetical protein AFV9_gp66 [Acidianus filamentous virus 9]ACB37300.1 hypothetical protein [Acidianus filamentous virus 9]